MILLMMREKSHTSIVKGKPYGPSIRRLSPDSLFLRTANRTAISLDKGSSSFRLPFARLAGGISESLGACPN